MTLADLRALCERATKDVIERRFFSHVFLTNVGCWPWRGARTSGGYATFQVKGLQVTAHRWLYDRWFGLHANLDLDHLCRNRWCVNPTHLEPVSNRENILRPNALGITAQNARKTVCPLGHPYDAENTRRDGKGKRHCRECQRQLDRRLRLARLDEAGR